MTYYFISSDQQRFSPFQDSVSSLGDSFLIEDDSQIKDVLSEKPDGFFFIHLIPNDPQIEKMVRTIRQNSSSAIIIHVLDDLKSIDPVKHRNSASGGDSYVSIKSTVDQIRAIVQSLAAEGGPPALEGIEDISRFANHPLSQELDSIFKHLVKNKPKMPATPPPAPVLKAGASMSDNKNDDDAISLINNFDDDLSLSDGTDEPPSEPEEEGMDLMLSEDSEDLALSDDPEENNSDESAGLDDFDLGDIGDAPELSEDNDLNLSGEEQLENLGELDLGDINDLGSEPPPASLASDDLSDELKLSDDIPSGEGVVLDANDGALDDNADLDFGAPSLSGDDDELSEDAKKKLREIDAIMENTSSQIVAMPLSDDDDDDILEAGASLDESLVGDDLNLDSLDFSSEQPVEEEKPKKAVKKKEEEKQAPAAEGKASPAPSRAAPEREVESTRPLAAELREISGAYTVEMERAQATISNLRSDREELLAKIQLLEEDKVMHNRQTLTIRAELDERKIELSIIRKKLNEEITELKDRLKFHDERRMILEEKNRIYSQELDKANQKNKIDLKKVQMRERELEQKLELLKSDAETQIRHRDLKILELKRKIDAMEFDMESIQVQEKKSVESRFELEDKLEKAIKTLRSAITVLEDESDRDSAVMALKKNIDV